MRVKLKPVLLHLPSQWIEDLDWLVTNKYYANRSEAIRFAILDLLKNEVWRTRKNQHPINED